MYHSGGDVDNGGGSVCVCVVGVRGIWKISVPPSEFCYEPKTALEIKAY